MAQTAAGITVSGVVRDRVSGKTIENVTVSAVGTSVGTVTNADGFFSLTLSGVPDSLEFELSHVGYINTTFPAAESEDMILWMLPVARVLDEAVVYGENARLIVEEALKRIPYNYSPDANLMSTFYRETIQKRKKYIGISEAMVDVYKTDYSRRGVNSDRVHIVKARRLLSQKASDTLAIKVQGGPAIPKFLDVVKNPDVLFDRQTMGWYDFEQEASALINNRVQYVIRFRPRVEQEYALYTGKLFIDSETMTFTRAEFSLDLSDHDKAVSSILRWRPPGLRFRLLGVNYLVSYRERDGISYLNYISNKIHFKCDWKRRLFSSPYLTVSEMVVVDNDLHPESPIPARESFRLNQVFYDVVDEYWQEDFWKDYNIIEPTESLENAVRRLRK